MEEQSGKNGITRTITQITDSTMAAKFSAKDTKVFNELLMKVRSLPERYFSNKTRAWNIPISPETVEKLISWGFVPDDRLKKLVSPITLSENTKFLEQKITEISESIQQKKKNSKNTNFNFDQNEIFHLKPFQKKGVAWIEQTNGRTLIADEMRLGKSAQAITWTTLHPELRPCVIICPATVKIAWKREILKWAGENSYVIHGTNNVHGYENEKYIILNYDILKAHIEKIKSLNPQILILDEIQKIKNMKTKRTRFTRDLGKYCKHIIALSGTPIEKGPIEFYSVLSLLRKDLFNNLWKYQQRWCSPQFNGFGWVYTGASNTEELNSILTSTIMIRRLRRDVLNEDLPTRQVLPVEINNKEEYNKAETDIIQWIRENISDEKARRAKRAIAFSKFNYLKQIAAKGKMDAITEWIDDFLESGKKLVVFCTHHAMIDMLMEKYNSIAVKLDGRDSTAQRQNSIDNFQYVNKIKLFFGNLQAAGMGIDLSAASDVLICELGWNPAEHDQGESRIEGMNQKEKTFVYYIVAEKTIEEDIIDILDRKKKILDAVLDGKESEEDSVLGELLKRFVKKEG